MNKTTISIPKILISLIVYFALPLSAAWLNQFVDSMTITHTMIYSATALILISLNWEVFSLHLHRFAKNMKDGLLFTLICFIVIILLQLAYHFILLPDNTILEREILLTPSSFRRWSWPTPSVTPSASPWHSRSLSTAFTCRSANQ